MFNFVNGLAFAFTLAQFLFVSVTWMAFIDLGLILFYSKTFLLRHSCLNLVVFYVLQICGTALSLFNESVESKSSKIH